ncbi:MAG: hypothetical protein C4523_09285 [Myxococcales bacterium]|nr:MAG: hypothetical protein C4523_09285 [Myxococcales bacterium]
MRVAQLLFATVVFLLLGAFAVDVQAGEPKHVNPKPTFAKTPPDQEAALALKKLGQAPNLSAEEWKKILAGEILVRPVGQQGEARTVEAVGVIEAPPKAVAAFMRDYPAYVGPMPHLKKIDAKWDGNLATVEQTLKVAFFDVWYRLRILHYGDYAIEWEYEAGDIKDTRGYYKLFPTNQGRHTLVVYHVFTDPGLPVPAFVVELMTTSSMPDVLKAIRQAVLARQAR